MSTCENLVTKSEFDQLAKQVKQLNGDILTLGNLVGQVNVKQAGLGAGLAKVASDIVSLGAALLGLKNTGDNFNLSEQVKANKQSIAGLESLFNTLFSESQKDLQAIKQVEKTANDAAAKANAAIVEAEVAQITANNASSQANNATAQANQLVNEINNLNTALSGDIGSLSAELSQVKAESQGNKAAIANIQSLVNSFQGSIGNLQGSVNVLETEIGQTVGLINSQAVTIQVANSKIATTTGQISDIKAALNTIASQFSGLKSELNKKANKSEIPKSSSGGSGGNTSQLQKQVDTLDSSISSLNTQLAGIQTQTSQAQASIEQQLKATQAEVKQNKKTITTIFAPGSDTFALSGSGTASKQNTEKIAVIQNDIIGLKKQSGANDITIKETTTKVANLDSKTAANSKDITALKTATATNTAVNQNQFNQVIDKIANNPVTTAAAITAALTPTLQNIVNQTNASAISTAAATGVCSTTAPGGCMQNNVVAPLSNQLGTLVSGAGTGLSAANNALLQSQGAILNTINTTTQTTLGIVSSASHGLQATKEFLDKAWQATGVDKVLNAISAAMTIHNGVMLSNNLAQSIGDVASITLDAVGIQDQAGNPIDVNTVIKTKLDSLISSFIGAENYATLSAGLAKANRIYQASANVANIIHEIGDTTRSATNTIVENTGRIGNALKEAAVIPESAYPTMAERINPLGRRQRYFEAFRDKLDQIEEGASVIGEISSEVVEIKDNIQELDEAWKTFDAEVETIKLEKQTEVDEIKQGSLTTADPTDADFAKVENNA